jgi:NADPH-dependent 2,4-dienoyl-CoA reductase/sulfur reductase-like enzyme
MAEIILRREAVACCVAGGGPAGMMLGFLLARAGVTVAVLEKHADFFRDFRMADAHDAAPADLHSAPVPEPRAVRQALPIPLAITLLRRFPVLRRIPARLVGIGFRPEHVSG